MVRRRIGKENLLSKTLFGADSKHPFPFDSDNIICSMSLKSQNFKKNQGTLSVKTPKWITFYQKNEKTVFLRFFLTLMTSV